MKFRLLLFVTFLLLVFGNTVESEFLTKVDSRGQRGGSEKKAATGEKAKTDGSAQKANTQTKPPVAQQHASAQAKAYFHERQRRRQLNAQNYNGKPPPR